MIDFSSYDAVIAGCGLSGAVLAERLANSDKKVLILEKREHIGGNCFDYIDENGILINKYGAHIFHTENQEVWEYIQNFSEWVRWDHKVLAYIDEKFVPVPVNINTVNQLFSENIKDKNEMKTWLHNYQIKFDKPKNSEEVCLSRVGSNLYEKLFRPYTFKQWNKYPHELDPEVLSRIPVRDNFDDRYFTDRYQALPKYGYTKFFENLINHKNIEVKLNTNFLEYKEYIPKDKIIIFTGPIDHYFNQTKYPKLEYRSINFIKEIYKNVNFYQPNSVVNYPDQNVHFTRIIEYKHFLNQKSDHTTIVKEITTDEGEPYYPVPNKDNQKLYEQYKILADKEKQERNIHFIGRLANYKYFNMDQAISNALNYFKINFE